MLNVTVGGLLDEAAAKNPDVQAVKYTDRDYCRSYKEFNEEVKQVAKGLLAIGIKKGDRVAIWATNRPEWLVALFATAKIGAILVTVNTNYKIFEMEYLLRQSESKALIMCKEFKDVNYFDIINELCPTLKNSEAGKLHNPRLPFLEVVITMGNKLRGAHYWDELEERGHEISNEQLREISDGLDPHDVINMQYTSGTTGFPKGVMLTHYNIVNNGLSIGDRMKFTEKDRLCIPVPFFHCFGLVLAIMASVTHSTGMVPIETWNPLKVMQAVESEECTAVHGVPTMFIAMLEHPEFKKFKFPRLRTGIMAGSPCPVKVMQLVIEEMGCREITIVYGQTESSPGCTQTTTDDSIEKRVSTVGTVFPGVEAKIVDPETGKTCPPNVQGEFCTRGYHIMKGYYNMPEATAQVIDADGWLHTGDLATVTEDGYYKITGRIKDMIIRGGENIYPKEIEEFLYTHPKVKDVQVIGVPSEQYGEELLACIIIRDGMTLTEDEIKESVRANMARHKTPRYVEFVESFPMTASGKVQKYKMREWAIEKLGLQDAAGIETA